MTDWSAVPHFGVVPPGVQPTPRPSAYAVLRRSDGALAVVRAPAGVFLPGGGLEPGEGVDEALHREVREECGLRVTLGAWRTRAVDQVDVPAEGQCVAKQSTFVEATVAGPADRPGEPEHALV